MISSFSDTFKKIRDARIFVTSGFWGNHERKFSFDEKYFCGNH